MKRLLLFAALVAWSGVAGAVVYNAIFVMLSVLTTRAIAIALRSEWPKARP